MHKTPDEIKKGLECCNVACEWDNGCPYMGLYSECTEGLKTDALAYIQQLEAKVPRWISVEERLPEPYKSVLVYVKHTPEFFSEWSVVMEDCWLGDGWDCNADTEVREVTHWMPLPSAEGLNDN